MKYFSWFFAIFFVCIVSLSARADDIGWPRTIDVSNGYITLYEPQPEALDGNKLSVYAAVSFTIDDQKPIFGAMWAVATLETNRDRRMTTMESIKVTIVKFRDTEDHQEVAQLEEMLKTEMSQLRLDFSMDRIVASLNSRRPNLSEGLNNAPPEIIYVDEPTLLVVIDGEPRLQNDKNLLVSRVINTPFMILQSSDGNFYLHVSGKWFQTRSISGQWAYTRNLPEDIVAAGKKIEEQRLGENGSRMFSDVVPMIKVCTEPTELIQSNGDGDFKSIQNTSLLYISNTEDHIFMETESLQYYVLLSGRWYTSPSLRDGPWQYVKGRDLPTDFTKIPEGSEKDIVLASIPGTDAAQEAITDAHVPQTIKVDPGKATTSVVYEGAPKFEPIPYTGLSYAINTSSPVLKEENKYYTVDNGIWFDSNNAQGPWIVSISRPSDVDNIPADNPTYYTKYVYIYDITPDYIHVGYTSGYLGCYVYEGAVVYGTGFHYNAWHEGTYFPRPVTWGFGMRHNPWTGWSMGTGVNVGVFHFSFDYDFRLGHGLTGGWWGPVAYHPPFHYAYSHYYGRVRPVVVPPHNNIQINNYQSINVNNSNTGNLYNYLSVDAIATDGVGSETTKPVTQGQQRIESGNPNVTRSREANSVNIDQNGNIYRQDADGLMLERYNNSWRPIPATNRISTVQQRRSRGQDRTVNFQQSHSTPSYVPQPVSE